MFSVTVAGADVPCASEAVKVKLSLPLKFGAGVYVRTGGVPLSVPFAGGVAMANVKVSPSVSVAISVTVAEVSSGRLMVRGVATGGSFEEVMVSDTVAGADVSCPSEAVKVKLS